VVFVVGISGVAIPVGQAQLRGMVLATLVGNVLSLAFYVMERLGWTNEPPEALGENGLEAGPK
jgi:uracil permease